MPATAKERVRKHGHWVFRGVPNPTDASHDDLTTTNGTTCYYGVSRHQCLLRKRQLRPGQRQRRGPDIPPLASSPAGSASDGDAVNFYATVTACRQDIARADRSCAFRQALPRWGCRGLCRVGFGFSQGKAVSGTDPRSYKGYSFLQSANHRSGSPVAKVGLGDGYEDRQVRRGIGENQLVGQDHGHPPKTQMPVASLRTPAQLLPKETVKPKALPLNWQPVPLL